MESKAAYEAIRRHSLLLVPVEIVPDDGIVDVLGSMIQSARKNGEKHFVSPKEHSALPGDLVFKVKGATAALFLSNTLAWDGDGETVPNEPLKRKLKRDQSGHYTISVRVTGTGQVAEKLNVWILWASGHVTNVPQLAWGRGSAVAENGNSYTTYDTRSGGEPQERWRFKFSIEPHEIIDPTYDIPDLRGTADRNYLPPGGLHVIEGDETKEGVWWKWDVSRKLQIQISNPFLIPKEYFAADQGRQYDNQPLANSTPEPFPVADVEGNDDGHANISSKQCNPYVIIPPTGSPNYTHDAGEIVSSDRPGAEMSEGGAQEGYTYAKYMRFREFSRVQLNKKWYRISDFLDWHHHLKIKYQNGHYEDDGSSAGLGHD